MRNGFQDGGSSPQLDVFELLVHTKSEVRRQRPRSGRPGQQAHLDQNAVQRRARRTQNTLKQPSCSYIRTYLRAHHLLCLTKTQGRGSFLTRSPKDGRPCAYRASPGEAIHGCASTLDACNTYTSCHCYAEQSLEKERESMCHMPASLCIVSKIANVFRLALY